MDWEKGDWEKGIANTGLKKGDRLQKPQRHQGALHFWCLPLFPDPIGLRSRLEVRKAKARRGKLRSVTERFLIDLELTLGLR